MPIIILDGAVPNSAEHEAELKATQRMEGVTPWLSDGWCSSSTHSGIQTLTCPSDSTTAYLVFLALMAHDQGDDVSCTVQSNPKLSLVTTGTYIQTRSGSDLYNYREWPDPVSNPYNADNRRMIFAIVRLEPGQYIKYKNQTGSDSGDSYHSTGGAVFVVNVPKA